MKRGGIAAWALGLFAGLGSADAPAREARPASTVEALLARSTPAAALLAEAEVSPVVESRGLFQLTARAPRPASPSSRWRTPARDLSIELPADARGAIHLGPPGSARHLAFHRAFASAAHGRIERGALVYPDAIPGADAVDFARAGELEELLVVRDPGAEIAYDVELPDGASIVAPEGFPGLAEVRDASGHTLGRMTADRAWDASGAPVPIHVAVGGARIRVTVSPSPSMALPIVVDPSWNVGGRMAFGRSGHTATLLPSGKVLLAGGRDDDRDKSRTAELYDPRTDTFTATQSPMSVPRAHHAATLLRNGQVLLAGGFVHPPGDPTTVDKRTDELYDPDTDTFVPLRSAAELGHDRTGHTATMLRDGRVLVAGDEGDPASATERFDPARNLVDALAPTLRPRAHHTATRLPSGEVLLAGGDGSTAQQTAELYDPIAGAFTSLLGPMHAARRRHTATLLRDGRVLLAGGDQLTKDPGGGPKTSGQTAELFVPGPGGGAFQEAGTLGRARLDHTATLLPSGRLLLAGGSGEAGASSELFDPSAAAFAPLDALVIARYGGHTATLLPSGRVLIAGGYDTAGADSMSPYVEVFEGETGAFETTGSMLVPRVGHTATLLPSGHVFIAGGGISDDARPGAEIYDPAAGTFALATGADPADRTLHTATLLLDGNVLLAGGQGGDQTLDSAQIFDPRAGALHFVPVSMTHKRLLHTATLLPSGKVLIAGGLDETGGSSASAELYDPPTGTFDSTSTPMTVARHLHTATLLPSGQVLIAAGISFAATSISAPDFLSSAELYDPATDSFHPTGSMITAVAPAGIAGATLLPSGHVLFLGPGTPEIYDPEAGTFSIDAGAGGTSLSPIGHTATLLPSGRVLLDGGDSALDGTPITAPTIYEPATGSFLPVASAPTTRKQATATLLGSGKVLIAGGDNAFNTKLASCKLWNDAPGSEAFRPVLSSAPAEVTGGTTVALGGEWGLSRPDTGGGGTTTSATDLPLVVWMPIQGGSIVGRLAPWTDTSATWSIPATHLAGRGLLFVTAGGVISAGTSIRLREGLECTSNLDCPNGKACSATGACTGPVVTAGAPPATCAHAPGSRDPAPLGTLLAAAVIAAVRSRRSPRVIAAIRSRPSIDAKPAETTPARRLHRRSSMRLSIKLSLVTAAVALTAAACSKSPGDLMSTSTGMTTGSGGGGGGFTTSSGPGGSGGQAVTSSTTGGTGGGSTSSTTTATSGTTGSGGGAPSGGTEYAPYFYAYDWDGGGYPFQSLADLRQKTGIAGVTLAFVLSNGGCKATHDVQDHQGDVDAFRNAGGKIKASFGGADGTYLENACGDAASLAQAIGDFVDQTGINDLDFDVEQDGAVTNQVNQRRAQALKMVQDQKGIQVAFTLPVMPADGVPGQSLEVVKAAVQAGVKISHVNVMIMDYYTDLGGKAMGEASIDALGATKSQLQGAIAGLGDAEAWGMIGATPMIGQNDDPNEVFSLGDAQALADFVKQNHVGLVAFWAINRDQPGSGDLGYYSQAENSKFAYHDILKSVAP